MTERPKLVSESIQEVSQLVWGPNIRPELFARWSQGKRGWWRAAACCHTHVWLSFCCAAASGGESWVIPGWRRHICVAWVCACIEKFLCLSVKIDKTIPVQGDTCWAARPHLRGEDLRGCYWGLCLTPVACRQRGQENNEFHSWDT